MAECVIDHLEAIEIEKKQGAERIGGDGRCAHCFKRLHQLTSIRQVGQVVVPELEQDRLFRLAARGYRDQQFFVLERGPATHAKSRHQRFEEFDDGLLKAHPHALHGYDADPSQIERVEMTAGTGTGFVSIEALDPIFTEDLHVGSCGHQCVVRNTEVVRESKIARGVADQGQVILVIHEVKMDGGQA